MASGDPLPDAVILWTRVTPPVADEAGSSALAVEWIIARDRALSRPVARGSVEASASSDYTVKVDARGLEPGTTYFYQFRSGDMLSPVGTTRTLPSGATDRLRMAVTSCANYPQGFFHAYRGIAERSDLDVVLYLGDYVYEFANGVFGDGAPIGRVPEPDRELVTLDDYRRRHAQYKTDPDLQAVHLQHPCIAVWDDHDVANGAHRHGAENHQPRTEGDWSLRKRNAMRAFHEWMPIRSDPERPDVIYRSFAFGDLCDLVMLDTRLVGRAPQVADLCDAARVADASRSLLGEAQDAWLEAELAASAARGARWRLIGQQVRFSELPADPSVEGCVDSSDNWNGYAESRRRALDAFERAGNVVILTGDTHVSWAIDVPRSPFDPAAYEPETGRGSVAVELVVPGVSSLNTADPAEAARGEQHSRAVHPHVKLAEHFSQGYVVVELDRERLRAQWYYVSSVRERTRSERPGGSVESRWGENHLRRG